MGEVAMQELEGKSERAEDLAEQAAALKRAFEQASADAERAEDRNKTRLQQLRKQVQDAKALGETPTALEIGMRSLPDAAEWEASKFLPVLGVAEQSQTQLEQALRLAGLSDGGLSKFADLDSISLKAAALGMTNDLVRSTALGFGQSALEVIRGCTDLGARSVLESVSEIAGLGMRDTLAGAQQAIEAMRQATQITLPVVSTRDYLEGGLTALAKQWAAVYQPIERWAEEQQQERERMLAAFANLGMGGQPTLQVARQQIYQHSRTPIYQPSPSRIPRRPVPPAQPPKPLDAEQILEGNWQEALALAIKQRKLSPAKLIKFALQLAGEAAPGQKRPPWAEIEAICLDYERNSHRYNSQEAFARKHNISKATFTRYRRLWKAAQGDLSM